MQSLWFDHIWDKCFENMSLGFNYFTTFPVLNTSRNSGIITCIETTKYLQSNVPGAKSTTVNQNYVN